MEKELEPFADHEYEPQEIDGRPLKLHGQKNKRKKVEENKIPRLYKAMSEGRDVDIRYAIIDGGLSINELIDAFELIVDADCRFAIGGRVRVRDSEIHGATDFSDVCIKGHSDFSGTTFREFTSFCNCRFAAGVRFVRATFGGYVEFERTVFEGPRGWFDFSESIFVGIADFKEVQLKNILSGSRGRLIFMRSQFGALPEFSLGQLDPRNYDRVAQSCRKSGLLGIGHLFEEAGKGYSGKPDHSRTLEAFRNAKIEYEKEGQYSRADDMLVREKDSTRSNLKTQPGNHRKKAGLFVLKHSCDYGMSWGRFFWCMVIVIIAFAVIYMPIIPNWISCWPSITFEKYPFHGWDTIAGCLYNIVTAIYFSVVTFATLGFGDILPTNILGRICTIGEVLLGYLMFGILITIVARKVIRS